MKSWKRRSVLVTAGLIVAVLVVAGGAIAQVTFPDVDEDNPHFDGITWAAEAGIIQGYTNGNFGPFDPQLRGQTATMFMRYDEFRMEPVAARRGCEDCHEPTGQFSLKNEAVNAANIGSHTGLADDADLNDCLVCHAMEADGTGTVAIAMRDIVHPVHMGSKIFSWELMGNCFSCHNVDANGEFDVLPFNVATDDGGIPDVVPIATQQDPVTPAP
jgi:hypothetical protein